MSITILIHSSKTMRSPSSALPPTTPLLIDKAKPLGQYLQTLSPKQLQTAMQISAPLSFKVHAIMAEWNTTAPQQSLAIDSFIGDIYSGLQAGGLQQADRDYAQHTLRILSGLYGILRPLDGVRPYRLEMGYKLPHDTYGNLYRYWQNDIAKTLPSKGYIINLSAVEYTKTVLPYIDPARVITPRFLTISPKTGKPAQVIVHTKIARGAFARWLIINRVTSVDDLQQFAELGYRYDESLSAPFEPTFICNEFGGIGLSVRLVT